MILRVHDATTPGLFANVRTVFLDRDGVINRKAPEGEYVATWEQFEPLPGVDRAIARLHASGRRVFVVTNQRGVALGLYTSAQVEALHRQVADWLAPLGAYIDGFYYCPHDKASCTCRKPLPGLFEQAFAEHPGLNAASSIIIGDSLSDIQAGKRFGMRAIFIEGEPERQKPGSEKGRLLADASAGSLEEAVALLE
jgi:D-glycero-D-manno-heptose 1,7-bisphosphate phosphatase